VSVLPVVFATIAMVVYVSLQYVNSKTKNNLIIILEDSTNSTGYKILEPVLFVDETRALHEVH
jgi:hypothetical protein